MLPSFQKSTLKTSPSTIKSLSYHEQGKNSSIFPPTTEAVLQHDSHPNDSDECICFFFQEIHWFIFLYLYKIAYNCTQMYTVHMCLDSTKPSISGAEYVWHIPLSPCPTKSPLAKALDYGIEINPGHQKLIGLQWKSAGNQGKICEKPKVCEKSAGNLSFLAILRESVGTKNQTMDQSVKTLTMVFLPDVQRFSHGSSCGLRRWVYTSAIWNPSRGFQRSVEMATVVFHASIQKQRWTKCKPKFQVPISLNGESTLINYKP